MYVQKVSVAYKANGGSAFNVLVCSSANAGNISTNEYWTDIGFWFKPQAKILVWPSSKAATRSMEIKEEACDRWLAGGKQGSWSCVGAFL